MGITNRFRKFERAFDEKMKQFLVDHPMLGFLFALVGVPVLILSCVCLCTLAVAFPMACIFGWF